MTFLAPLALLGLLALAVPVVLHLIKRSEVKGMDWAAMEFLEEREVKSVSRKSLDNIPLLLARLGIVAFLILALARPVGNLLNWRQETPDTVFILLDRSPEMAATRQDGTSFLKRAIEDIQVALEDFPQSPRVYLIDSASLEVTPIMSPDYLSLLPQADLTDSPASVTQMLSKGVSEYQQDEFGKTEFWIVSSNARDTWIAEGQVTLAEIAPEEISVRSFVYDTEITGDVQIDYLGAELQNQELVLGLEIRGEEPGQTILLSGEWSSGEGIQEEIEIEDGRTRYELGLLVKSKSGSGYLELPADPNVANNRIYFSYGPPLDTHTVLITDNQESSLTDYLKRAAALSSRPNQKVQWIAPEDVILTDLSQFDLVIWAAGEEGVEKRMVIEDYVSNGGIAVVFPSPKGESHADGWFFGQVEAAPFDEYFSITKWNEKAGPWKNADNGELMPLSHLQGVLVALPEVPIDNKLAVWSHDVPALARNILGEGELFLVSALPLATWSNMENLALHLILFQRLLEGLNAEKSGGYSDRLIAGKKPYEAQLITVDDGRVVSLNRAPRSSLKRISKAERQSLLVENEFNEATAGSRPMRPWLYPFLFVALVFFLLEAILQVVRKNRARTGKEVKYV